jgi:hypothetical protein
MTQEKLSAARTTTIVIYKVVLDTIFFIGTLPLLCLLAGPQMIRPHMNSFSEADWRAQIFYISYVCMAVYGSFFFYGLFVNPVLIKKLLTGIASLPFLKRWKPRAEKLGAEIILASEDMRNIGWKQHLAAFGCTITAWTCKFFLISCLIYGIGNTTLGWSNELLLYARLEAMFVILAFSPSPGGAGFVEATFHPFLMDFIPDKGIAIVIALIWRLMSYYAYLAAGAIIVPNWIRKVFLKNLKDKKAE